MIVADTGFWIALINRQDKHHLQAREQLRLLTADRETLITTCAVMTETGHLLVQRLGTHAQDQFMSSPCRVGDCLVAHRLCRVVGNEKTPLPTLPDYLTHHLSFKL